MSTIHLTTIILAQLLIVIQGGITAFPSIQGLRIVSRIHWRMYQGKPSVVKREHAAQSRATEDGVMGMPRRTVKATPVHTEAVSTHERLPCSPEQRWAHGGLSLPNS